MAAAGKSALVFWLYRIKAGNMTRAAPSRWVTWLALLAFLLQGLVAQSHIHIAALKAATAAHHGSSTPPKEPADCPACQLQAATAAALMPHGITAFLPLSWVESIALSVLAFSAGRGVHQGWQSRAPPQR